MTAPVLQVEDLRVHFFLDEGLVRAVDGVGFDVHPGQVVGIVGESGCGKSVTMKAILQIVEPPGRIVGGRIRFQKHSGVTVDLTQLSAKSTELRAIRGAEIALIPQEPMAAFSPVHSVGEQIIEALRLHERQWRPSGPRLSKAEARSMTVDLFRSVGISMPHERVDAYSWQLSGGLRQRAMIAMALSCRPRLLIADEPTTAIDVTTQAQILNLLRDLQRRHDAAIVYVGRLVEIAAAEDIFRRPRHPYTAALLRAVPVPDPHAPSGDVALSGEVANPATPPSGCYFHPRCPFATEICRSETPPIREIETGHLVRCHRADELALTGVGG